MSFTSEDVALMLQIARDASLGNTVGERLTSITEPLSALVPNTSLSAIILQRNLDAPAEQAHAFFRNGDPSNVRRYAEHYIQYDPHPQFLASVPGQFVPHSQLVPTNRWGKDPFTGEFLTDAGLRWILGGELPLPDGRYLSFAIHREKRLDDFTKRECEVLRLVSEDLRRAVYGAIVQERLTSILHESDVGTGFLVVGPHGDVVRSDASAQYLVRLLEQDGGVPADLVIADAHRLSQRAPREGDRLERVFLLGDGRRIQVQLTALASGKLAPILCLLQLREAPPRSRFDEVADTAGLTPREREVARLAIEGLGNRHIAYKLGCSPVTVGVHLTRIYRKTDVSNRIELTRHMTVDGNSGTTVETETD